MRGHRFGAYLLWCFWFLPPCVSETFTICNFAMFSYIYNSITYIVIRGGCPLSSWFCTIQQTTSSPTSWWDLFFS